MEYYRLRELELEVFNLAFTMATTTKNRASGKKKTIVDKTMKDYTNDPFFIKKREMALKLIKKAGLPNSFAKKK